MAAKSAMSPIHRTDVTKCYASHMPSRTVYLPPKALELVREHAREGESFSATVVRLIKAGAHEDERHVLLDYLGSGEGPGDLGVNNEKYLGLKPWGPGEGPGGGR
ncbi:MAG TPA: hypothetical protein VFT19_09400 [Solirubrobacterales bacterium]|nr:hypothetical protein [Solirubrobacterales bacterium]